MANKITFPQLFLGFLSLGAVFLGACLVIPWRLVDWGKIQLAPARTITVTGEAKTQERPQIATFTAGVSAVNDDKNTAVDEVNEKIKTVIEAVKNFGVAEKDVKTQNLSIYQMEENYYDEGVAKYRPGQWRVSNEVSVILRNLDRTSELADLLSGSGATNVYGPNLALDETQAAEESLLGEALENARSKAEIIAQSGGGRLGRIISVSEGYQNPSLSFYAEGLGGGGGTPIEPGTATVWKTVTVVFELK